MPYVVTLTPSDLEFGKALVAALKQEGFPLRGAFWFYDENSDDWNLVVVTDQVDRIGPRKTYLQLSKVTKAIAASDFQLLRVTVWSPKHPVYQALSSVFAQTASVEGARLRHTMVNGLHISDAYLYEIH